MKILLVGHSIIDHFEETGDEISHPGGIFYSMLGINSVAKTGDEIFLLTGWNQNNFYLFKELYSRANLIYSNKLMEMPEVLLKTSGEGEREEIYKNLSTQLSNIQVDNWNQFDGILINMITGLDISIEQLQIIRKNFSGKIYFDVHTLSRGVDINNRREFRQIPKVEEWLTNIDILQCNENELNTIFADKMESEIAKEIIGLGVEIVVITKGNKGACLYFNLNGKIETYIVHAEKVDAVNKIGCGDIFGAVFFYSYISTRDVNESLQRANIAGAAASSIKNITSQTMIKLNA